MRQTWRWFGPKDLVSIDDMMQAGVQGVVSALHHVPTGAAWSADEIATRAVLSMIEEGFHILAEGIARRPADIDLVLVHGYGFPRWRGGPMHWADAHGLDRILADIRRFAEDDDHFWQPAPLLAELVADGRGFADLNQGTSA